MNGNERLSFRGVCSSWGYNDTRSSYNKKKKKIAHFVNMIVYETFTRRGCGGRRNACAGLFRVLFSSRNSSPRDKLNAEDWCSKEGRAPCTSLKNNGHMDPPINYPAGVFTLKSCEFFQNRLFNVIQQLVLDFVSA